MLKLLSSIFTSNPGSVMDAAKGVGNWIDEQQFTEEEKSVANMKALEWQLKWINATQGMNIARRYLALMFAFTFLLTFLTCLISFILAHLTGKDASGLVAGIVSLISTFQLGWIMISIIVFYFGKGIAEGVLGGKK